MLNRLSVATSEITGAFVRNAWPTADIRPAWLNIGVQLIAVDTLVHNFLHRTGILSRFNAAHPYGPACYRHGGCADLVRLIASHIDARQFNRGFPKVFPRFVQLAIWRYCSQAGLDICNGNRLDDRHRCQNRHCRLYRICDRICLKLLSQINELYRYWSSIFRLQYVCL